MRVTQSSLLSASLRQIRVNNRQMSRAQAEVATGLKLIDASDDPVAARQAMLLTSRMSDLDRYHRAAVNARTLLDAQDAALGSARDLMAKARSLAQSVATVPAGDPSRAAIATQLRQIREQVMALANTQVGDRYVFAGAGPGGIAPYDANVPGYRGDLGSIGAEVDRGVVVSTTTPGEPVFGDALTRLENLAVEVANGDPVTTGAAITNLDAASQQMLSTQSDVGARAARIADADQRNATGQAQLKAQRDALVSADPAESGVKLTAAQSALERAYAAIGKVMSTNLLQYLR